MITNQQSEHLFDGIILAIVLAALTLWLFGCSVPPARSADAIRVSADAMTSQAERTQ